MAATLMRVDLSELTAVALCRGCSWRGSVHTGGKDRARARAVAEFDAHRRSIHATSARDTGRKRRKVTVAL